MTVRNVDLVGNTADGGVLGGILAFQALSSTGSPVMRLSNANLSGNQVTSGQASAVYAFPGDDLAIAYSNFRNNTGLAVEIAGPDDVIGVNGNIRQEPGFVDVAAADATAWDLSLAPGSALVDAGDPALVDADGTRSDIGAYGGAGGDGW